MATQKKLLIFGNSGSGKSSLAKHISSTENLAYLDLDSFAWLDTEPPQRMSLDDTFNELQKFIRKNKSWVIEGCYTDLLDLLSSHANEIIYLNLPIDLCVKNAKNRPWEPHKYESMEAQNENLSMLLDWIKQYETREDVFSKKSHLKFYHDFSGKKLMHTTNTNLV